MCQTRVAQLLRSWLLAAHCAAAFVGCSNPSPQQPPTPTSDAKAQSPVLRRDYGYPPGAITGESLRALTEKTESQIYGPLPEALRQEMIKKTHAVVDKKVLIVQTVRTAIEHAYTAFPDERREQLRSEYEASMTDITNIEERVRFGFAYPEPGSTKILTLVFGIPQVTEWRDGMLGWGVAHTVGVWPREFFRTAVDLRSMRARKVQAGNWKGAWELEDGRIFVPGLRFLTEIEVSVLPAR
jgi:hypothetical protein